MNPLAPDMSSLTDAELQEKINTLGKKLQLATRSNSAVVFQMRMLYNDYLEENSRRQQVKLQEVMDKNGKDFDDIINVG
jgi:argininosuccinate lyase